jgi:ABC-type uncharacterized transport system substrate-binding protein
MIRPVAYAKLILTIAHVWENVNSQLVTSITASGRLAQIEIFCYHRVTIVGFARLGVVYEDSPDGRTYANLTDLERVAAERGFTLVECHAQDNYVSESQSLQNVLRCFKVLAPDIDALWLSAHRGMNAKFMPEVLEPLYEHQVAPWSQVGAEEVRRGVLISVARRNLEGLGLWTAKVIAKIFHGARPRDLSQVYEWPLALAINLETAQRIGFDPPESVLSVSDQVYEHIQSGPLE